MTLLNVVIIKGVLDGKEIYSHSCLVPVFITGINQCHSSSVEAVLKVLEKHKTSTNSFVLIGMVGLKIKYLKTITVIGPNGNMDKNKEKKLRQQL